jgi:DNA repair exonuclease SbcCD ATPase subunit
VKNQEYDDEILTRFLLGSLPEEITDRLEELSIADDEMAARLQMIENDLVDAYVGGEMPASTLARFESHYLKSPKRHEKVSFARALRVYESKASGLLVTDAEQIPASRRSTSDSSERASWLRLFAGPRAALQWGFAAAAVLVLSVGGYLTIENLRLRQQMSQTQTERADLERRERELQQQLAERRLSGAETEKELALVRGRLAELEQQLASNANRQAEIKFVALTLSPQTRGINQIKPLVLPPGTNYVAITLELDANDFTAYRASLKNPASGQTEWTSGKLAVRGNSQSIRLRLPASLLKPQNYALELSGISENGDAEIVGSYPFRVMLE